MAIFDLGSDGLMYGRIVWNSEADINTNTSSVSAWLQVCKDTDYSPTTGTFSGSLIVGAGAVSDSHYGSVGDWVTVVEVLNKTVQHNPDGTGQLYLSGTINGPSGTSLAGCRVSGNTTVDLPLIPRGSTFTCSGSAAGNPLGSKLTFNIDAKNSSFVHTIKYECGDASGVVVTRGSNSKYTWTPPLSLAAQNTQGRALNVKFTMTTHNGSTDVGKTELTVPLTIPESVAPTVSVSVEDADGYFGKYGGYVQGQSVLNVKLTSAGIYGSDIVTEKVTVDGQTLSGSDVTTDVLKTAGTVTLTATVKDSRGVSNTATVDLTVLEYEPPKVTDLIVNRCTKTAKADPKGAYLMAQYSVVVSSLGNKNSATYTLHYKKTTETDYTTEELDSLAGVYVATNMVTVFAADTSSTYDVMLVVADNFTETVKTGVGQSISKLWSILAKGLGWAFGKVAELENTLDMGWRIHMNGNKITGLGSPTDSQDAVNKAYADSLKAYTDQKVASVYPVGAIYLSTVATSPASLFGGTWERIQDRFLLAAGGTYTAGKTGGAATHTLTVEEMPSHSHWGVYRPDWYRHTESGQASGVSDGTSSNQLYTDPTGGGKAHNNMPPYLAVYVWKRVA